jgi:ADP-heptose:LPS heptosyltransferase
MGSAILADPAMRSLKEKTQAELFFLIFERNCKSLSLLNTIPRDNIYTIRETNLRDLALDTIKFLSWARRKKIDTVVDLELFSRFTAVLSALSGASKRVGFYSYHNEGLYRGNFLTHKVAYNPHIHIAKNFLALTYSLVAERQELPYSKVAIENEDITLTKAMIEKQDIDAVRTKIKTLFDNYDASMHKLILVNSNASELLIQRRWMPEYYVELVSAILSNHDDVVVLLTGSKEEHSDCEYTRRRVNNDYCINSAGCFEFEELPALYSVAHLMVTNDSGPGHFSAVTNLKVFVFFGPETPSLYGSLGNAEFLYSNMACSPCVNAANHRKTPCTDNQCLKVIKPDYVYKRILPDLQRLID